MTGAAPPRRPSTRLRALRATCRIAFDLLRTWIAPPPPDAVTARSFDPAAGLQRRAASAPDADAETGVRIVSWNIHRHYDPLGVARGLERIRVEADPDVLLLQEVPVRERQPFWDRPEVRPTFAGLDLTWAPMHLVARRDPYYDFDASGQLTASRLRVASVAVVPLPAASRAKLGRRHLFRRIGLVTEVEPAAGVRIAIANLHLENTARPSGRARQLARLLAELPAGPAVVAGDLNTLAGRREPLWAAASRLGFQPVAVAGRRRLSPRLDHVLVRQLEWRDARELDVAGSDHRPVAAGVYSR